jgi:hypothetical protein
MKVKNVKFEIELEGHGIVNYDSGDQKFLWNRESKAGNKNKFTSADNNNMYAKKHYFRNENGDLDYKIKISSDCLRNSIFSGDAIVTNPKIVHHKTLLNSFIGSTLGLVRGYMFATKHETLKRKSPLTITSAIQTNNAESYMEFYSRSGEKTTKDDSDTGDTTIFNKESIGDITYSAKGFFNINDLEFISADTNHDRYSFNPDDYSILKTFLSKNLPNFDAEPGYYQLNTASTEAGEYGIKLTSEQIVYLIKEGLKRIYNININRSGSYATLNKMRVQLVNDLLNPKNNVWVDITSISDIDNLDFEVQEYYTKLEESQVLKDREIIEENLKLEIQKKKDAKNNKK